ncbi:cytochrome c [Paraburkholderia sp. GAS82]|uniref:cytochrome c n=1 Tax=Paraburkholderia sp. GAS82 TaxID=3035137 RepID=UPI003D1EF46C
MKTRSIGLSAWLCVLACTAFVAATSCWFVHPLFAATAVAEAPIAPPAADETATLKRGAELAAIGDCVVCHTAKHDAPFAGGRPLDTPFGVIYSTNITPDRQTGIGAWSLDDFKQAMRRGVSRDGHLLYPAFPYPHFTHMTDADIAAVYAYLMSRDAVQATAPANRLMFPLGFRPLIAVWNLFFLNQGVEPDDASFAAAATSTSTPTASHEEQLLRGRYLIDGPAHCAACHTPMNLLGAEKRDEAFDGNVIEGWQAPALTTLLRAPKPWTHDQLTAYLRTGLADQHGASAGPMRPVTQSLADASDADVDAMATYLLSLQTASATALTDAAPQEAQAQTQTTPPDNMHVQNGAVLFSATCASCHAAHAPMTTFGDRPSLALSTAVNAQDPRNALRLILDGIPNERGTSGPYMPAFAGTLTDAQIADLAAYLRANFSSQPAWSLDAANVEKLRQETSEP